MKLFLLLLISFFCWGTADLQAQDLPGNPWYNSQQIYSKPQNVIENRPSSLSANPWQNAHTSVPLNTNNLTSEVVENDKETLSLPTNQSPARKFGGLGHVSNISRKEVFQQNSANNNNKNNELSDLISNLKVVGYDIPDMPLTEKSTSSKNPLDKLSISDILDYKSLGNKGYQTIQNTTSPFINYMRGMVHSFERGSGVNLDRIISNTF